MIDVVHFITIERKQQQQPKPAAASAGSKSMLPKISSSYTELMYFIFHYHRKKTRIAAPTQSRPCPGRVDSVSM